MRVCREFVSLLQFSYVKSWRKNYWIADIHMAAETKSMNTTEYFYKMHAIHDAFYL
jgi:hypothetical protein